MEMWSPLSGLVQPCTAAHHVLDTAASIRALLAELALLALNQAGLLVVGPPHDVHLGAAAAAAPGHPVGSPPDYLPRQPGRQRRAGEDLGDLPTQAGHGEQALRGQRGGRPSGVKRREGPARQ